MFECSMNIRKANACNYIVYLPLSRAYEQAGLIAGKDMEKWNDASSFFEKSCQLFREHGVADTAALTYDRGAK